MAHPDLEHAMAFWRDKIGDILEQRSVSVCAHFGVAELAVIGPADLAAQLRGHGLHAVTNTQDRHTQLKYLMRHLERCFIIGRRVAAGQNHALEAQSLLLSKKSSIDIAGVNFTKHPCFAHASCNKLGNL